MNQRFFASIHIYIGLALILFVFACGDNGDSPKRNYRTTDYSSISKDSATKIWQQLFQRNPSFIAVSRYMDGAPLIFGLNYSDWRKKDMYEVYMLECFAGQWQVRQQKKYNREYMTSYIPDTFELVQNDSLFGLYFLEVSHNMGTFFNDMSPTRNYHFIQIPEFNAWEISYNKWSGEAGYTSIDSALRSEREILHFLEQKSLEDTLREIFSAEDFDLEKPKKAELKWKIDNPRLASEKGPPDSYNPGKINFTRYTQSLIAERLNPYAPLMENVISDNSYYTVWSFWGDLFVQERETKLYFPLFMGSCKYGCRKGVRHVSEHEIEIVWVDLMEESPNAIRVNLKTGHFEPFKAKRPFNGSY